METWRCVNAGNRLSICDLMMAGSTRNPSTVYSTRAMPMLITHFRAAPCRRFAINHAHTPPRMIANALHQVTRKRWCVVSGIWRKGLLPDGADSRNCPDDPHSSVAIGSRSFDSTRRFLLWALGKPRD